MIWRGMLMFVKINDIIHIYIRQKSLINNPPLLSLMPLHRSASDMWQCSLLMHIGKLLVHIFFEISYFYLLLRWVRLLVVLWPSILNCLPRLFWFCFLEIKLRRYLLTRSFFPNVLGNGFYLKRIGLILIWLDSLMVGLLVNFICHDCVRIDILEIEASVNSVLASDVYLASSCWLYLKVLLLTKGLCLILLLVSHNGLLHEEMVRYNLWIASFYDLLAHAAEGCLGPIMIVLNHKWRFRAYICWIYLGLLFLSFVVHQLLQNLNAAFLHLSSFLVGLLFEKLLASTISFLFRFLLNFLDKCRLG